MSMTTLEIARGIRRIVETRPLDAMTVYTHGEYEEILSACRQRENELEAVEKQGAKQVSSITLPGYCTLDQHSTFVRATDIGFLATNERLNIANAKIEELERRAGECEGCDATLGVAIGSLRGDCRADLRHHRHHNCVSGECYIPNIPTTAGDQP